MDFSSIGALLFALGDCYNRLVVFYFLTTMNVGLVPYMHIITARAINVNEGDLFKGVIKRLITSIDDFKGERKDGKKVEYKNVNLAKADKNFDAVNLSQKKIFDDITKWWSQQQKSKSTKKGSPKFFSR